MLLSLLPSEIVYSIVRYLPTTSCLWNLAQTCRHLYHVISADDYRIFQAFVQSRFPAIDTPPIWKDAARALTSRSRAFDRNAVVARYVLPSRQAKRIGQPTTVQTDRPTLGYRPAVDSYEVWYGERWFDRKELLAWGAGADLVIRTTDFNRAGPHMHNGGANGEPHQPASKWTIFNDLRGVDSWDDIASLHLLGPDQASKRSDNEDIILGRRHGKLVRMSVCPKTGSYALGKSYLSGAQKLEGTDLSAGPDKVLAATLGSRSIAFFRIDGETDSVNPFAILNPNGHSSARNGCSKLLSDERVAVGADGGSNKISISSFAEDGIINLRDINVDTVDKGLKRKSRVTVIEPLSMTGNISGAPGDLFLTGWEDSTVRLHDMRSPQSSVSSFADTVDHTPTYCLRSIGHERFVSGAGENALVKIFDMRMPGKYNYLDAGTPAKQTYHHHSSSTKNGNIATGNFESVSYPRKDMSIYLSQKHESTFHRPFPYEHYRYRGPIYTISHPSPSSQSFYVGIEGGIIRLDMANTDDLVGPNADWYVQNIDLAAEIEDSSFDPSPIGLTCYARPWPDDSTQRVNLLYQRWSLGSCRNPGRDGCGRPRSIPGWDCRWVHLWDPI